MKKHKTVLGKTIGEHLVEGFEELASESRRVVKKKKPKPPEPGKLYTSAEVAESLGCHSRSVQRAARNHKIGQTVGRALAFTDADIPKLRAVILRSPGNPNLGEGSNNGGGWPKGKPRSGETLRAVNEVIESIEAKARRK